MLNGQDLTRQGWLLSGIAEYKLDYVTPGLIAWYGSGDNSDTMDGSERLPTLSPGWGATTLGWDGAYGISDGAVLSNTPTGTWGVVARLADISFFENLTHTLAVGFYTGTNNTRMVTSGPVGGVESGNVYLTTKDHAWEVNFDSQYKIYENLTLAAEMGFVRLDLDKDVWGSKLSGVDKTAYNAPDELTLTLTHEDVWLDYFEDKKRLILSMRAGFPLTPIEEGLTIRTSTDVVRLVVYSKAFQARLAQLKKSGFTVQSAEIGFIVAWRKNPEDPELAVVLPTLHLKRGNSAQTELIF